MVFLSYFYWNPSREIFLIPYLQIPILWYSLFFALGFYIGYHIFYGFLKRYLLNYYHFHSSDIKNFNLLFSLLSEPKTDLQKELVRINHERAPLTKKNALLLLNGLFKTKVSVSLSPVRGVLHPMMSSKRLFLETVFLNCFITIKQKCAYVTDKVTLYVVIATIIGARLGHLLFYEKASFYLSHPLNIIKVWEGGLASHGAAIGILVAIVLLSYRLDIFPSLSVLVLLDLITLPASFVAGCIRIGNFFNQEILGKTTTLLWGVQFGNPYDGQLSLIRHPVQIYEAIFYFLLFGLFLFLSFKPNIYLKKGRLFALFLTLVFLFRFFIEFLKENQSQVINESLFLNMGQYLSLPFICLGLLLFYFSYKKKWPLEL